MQAVTGRRLRVFFEAELLLVGDEIPAEMTEANMRQVVQNETGYTGILVARVNDWEREDDA